MSNQIDDPPLEYDFGLEFNYAVWTADTILTLTNVPWNNDYRDIVKFNTRNELNTYIESKAAANVKISNVSYAKVNQPIRIDVPFNRVYRYNYLRASNPLQPIPGDELREFYYFITDVRYLSPNTTEIVVQLDVWQTFGYDVTFGNSYIERGHIGIANKNQMQNYGRDYLSIPEGLDTGSEYRVIARRRESVSNLDIENQISYDILVCSTVDLNADPGSVEEPKLTSASGNGFNGLPSGAQFYVFNGFSSDFHNFLVRYKERPWVTQGIISVTAIPKITRYYPSFTYRAYDPVTNPSGATAAPTGISYPRQFNMFLNWRMSDEIRNAIPSRYRHLWKFLTFPYMAIELTTWYGTPVVIKPECWADGNAMMLERASLVPPGQRITFHPRRYNAAYDSTIDDLWPALEGQPGWGGGDGDDGGDYLDVATQINGFPQVAIVNNNAVAYMASNAHSLAFQNQSADWSQQRALRGNEVSYDQASKAIELGQELTSIGRMSDTMQTALNNRVMGQTAITGAVSGVAMGTGMGMLGGPAGAVIGGVGAAGGAVANGINVGINQGANTESLSIRNAQNIGSNRAQSGQAGYVRDTNKNLADWAARGDYENSIAGINAKVQDSRLAQPSVSGQFGGEAINFINNTVELSARWKLIDNSAIRVIGEYWLRYGYAVRQFAKMPASLMVMTRFTYWKLSETYLVTAGMPETFKQAIRGIFEKGVTVWTNPADIGNIDIANNMPLDGIEL